MELLESSLIYIALLIAFVGVFFVIVGHVSFYSALNEIKGLSSMILLTLFPPLMFISYPYKDAGYERLRAAYRWWFRGIMIIATALIIRFAIHYWFHGEF